MTRTSPGLPLWAKILFESPELVQDIIYELKIKFKQWRTAFLKQVIKRLE